MHHKLKDSNRIVTSATCNNFGLIKNFYSYVAKVQTANIDEDNEIIIQNVKLEEMSEIPKEKIKFALRIENIRKIY